MIDFTKYEDLIKNQVAELNSKDPNWKWSVKYLGKTKVRIRWGYLDYIEEKKNCFILEMEHEKRWSGFRRLALGKGTGRRYH